MYYIYHKSLLYDLLLLLQFHNLILRLDRNIFPRNIYTFLTNDYYENLINVSKYLNLNGKIYNKSYEDILNEAKNEDFVFLDPPYIEDHEYDFNYNKNEQLDNSFLEKLLDEVKKLDKKNVKWLMTQSDTNQIKKLFKDYKIKKFKVFRSYKNEFVNELLIMNY